MYGCYSACGRAMEMGCCEPILPHCCMHQRWELGGFQGTRHGVFGHASLLIRIRREAVTDLQASCQPGLLGSASLL